MSHVPARRPATNPWALLTLLIVIVGAAVGRSAWGTHRDALT